VKGDEVSSRGVLERRRPRPHRWCPVCQVARPTAARRKKRCTRSAMPSRPGSPPVARPVVKVFLGGVMTEVFGSLSNLTASDWIAAIALIFSIFGLILGYLNNRGERQIQGRLLAIEEERQEQRRKEALRAKLQAYLQQSGPQNIHLVINNDGEAAAREVDVTLDGLPLLEHDIIPKGEQEARTIGPYSGIKYIAAISGDCPPPYEITIRWIDNSGQEGIYETTLR
jgi:hypothetical protein